MNSLLKWSINQRWIVVIASVLITIWGIFVVMQMPLDVIPNFAPPQVQIQTEAPGLAPEEIESLVTLPIETAINGTPGVTSVRSSSAVGLSVVNVVFDWTTDIYRARQLVTERVQQVQGKLPAGVEQPELTPINSPLGDIVRYAFTAETTSMMELKQIVNWQVRNRILAIPGVSQITLFGGDDRQYQVLVDPVKLQAFDVTLEQVTEAAANSNANAPGGFLINPDQEILTRGVGRITSLEDLQKSVITQRNGTPIRLSDVAEIVYGAEVKRGDGQLDGKPAVVMTVKKQPLADTVRVTEAVEKAIEELKASFPKDVKVTETFRQAEFIEASVKNVEEALRDGAIIVAVVLILFLMNWRTIIISLSAMPISLLGGLMLLSWLGEGINTMTLGGLVVAIGSVVDDAIVGMENVYRRLRENQLEGYPVPPLQIVFSASLEVRVSVLFSTVIIAVVFAPVFALSGVEGRIFTPMGLTYLLSIFVSTIVAVTLTPALCALLLVNRRLPGEETWIARFSEQVYRPVLRFALVRPKIVVLSALAALVASLIVLGGMGRIFLPEFQERSLVIALNLAPGVSLQTTGRVGAALAKNLEEDSRYEIVQMRSGRASGDIETWGVNFAEVDIELSKEAAKDIERSEEGIREASNKFPGVVVSVGGFISHRIDEVLSGVRSGIAVKIYGSDLDQLRSLGQQVQTAMGRVDGVVDLQLEQQIPIKQVQIKIDRDAASRYGLTIGELSETIETALNGKTVSQILDQQQVFDLFVWLTPDARQDLDTIRNLLIDTPENGKIPLAQVAQVDYGTGPNTINRENVSRLILVSANSSGRDLGSVIQDIRTRIQQEVQLPPGYFLEYGGQFEAEARASQTLIVFGLLALVIIAILMYFAVKSIGATLMILINLPLALVGGIFSLAVTGGVLSIASLVGFITLFGIAARNGLLLVDNYNQKLATGMPLKDVLFEGSQERLVAILMTAFSSALGMFPLTIGSGAGKEMLQPLAIVVLGGLFTSTVLTLIVLPALYAWFGRFLIPKQKDSELHLSDLGGGEVAP
ncbi:efflux RND transporter permease subunit [Chroococcus sp. FPU101]|uniref:efflux RND transporter permease subunit n=1 Tax=Chroococcus sp. FPU101 TaxID=1974212 RepID=UPI001A8C504F|nr:efflux RND transporter permease subunit [Chroococcus sp. FPU101]GFE68979.1 cation efflux system protein [Chroococcus sp. FPU101]